MLVTRGLGGSALVTAGLGDLGIVIIEVLYEESPGEFLSRRYETGATMKLPRDAAQRISAHNRIKALRRRHGGA